jgi:hypothetical protein
MRKIENFVVDALINKSCASSQNTVINYSTKSDISNIFLHGNHIFSFNHSTNKFIWNDCGFPTKTTASRLNTCFKALQNITGESYHYTYSRTNKTGTVINTISKEVIPPGNFENIFSNFS